MHDPHLSLNVADKHITVGAHVPIRARDPRNAHELAAGKMNVVAITMLGDEPTIWIALCERVRGFGALLVDRDLEAAEPRDQVHDVRGHLQLETIEGQLHGVIYKPVLRDATGEILHASWTRRVKTVEEVMTEHEPLHCNLGWYCADQAAVRPNLAALSRPVRHAEGA